MRDIPKLFLFVLCLTYLALFIFFYKFSLFFNFIALLLLIVYIMLTLITYNKFTKRYNQICNDKAQAFIFYDYSEVTPIHPQLLRIKYKISHSESIKVYAKCSLGYILNLKIVTAKKVYIVKTSDWIWFYANFKEKESN